MARFVFAFTPYIWAISPELEADLDAYLDEYFAERV